MVVRSHCDEVSARHVISEVRKTSICDIMSIACQSNMIPVKDLDEHYFRNEGRYYGDDSAVMSFRQHTVVITLRNPQGMMSGEKDYTMSRWTFIAVNQDFRTRKYDQVMHHYKRHNGVNIQTSKGTPYVPSELDEDKPIVAYRTYNDPSTAIVNLALLR